MAHSLDMGSRVIPHYLVRSKVLPLTCCLLVLSVSPFLRADHAADWRNERIPIGHKVHPPRHRHKLIIRPFDASSPIGNGYTPQQLRHAYGFDQLGTTGAGQIIAIVNAYGSPTIQADLNTFCTALGIKSTTVQVYYPQGTPTAAADWAAETSLDVEWSHAIAPDATIALVIAKSNSYADLLAAVDYAVGTVGAKQVSMSWGGPEYSTETSSDFHFNVPGVSFFASSGDSGAGILNPACSPYIVSVGGTSVYLNSSSNVTSETAWSGSGGGASVYEPAPSYQTGWWSGSQRGIPDVAYDADPATGIPIYETGVGWEQIGGTSMSAPQWAALFALANSLRTQSISSAPGVLYSLATANYAGYYRDIISGSNGAYSAGPGYDLVTGLGSPIGNQLVVALAGGFSSQMVAPVFFPPAGTYSNVSAQSVTIVSATSGASIRYTTDGSIPTETTGTLYSGPVSISANTTLTAIAYKSGLTDSTVTSGSYTFLPQVAAPIFSPAAGTYTSAQTVMISTTTSGASVRYTTDGSSPTETNGTLYSGPVSISIPTILNAIAYKAGSIDSPVTNGVYSISPLRVIYNFPATGHTYPDPSANLYPNALVQGNDGNLYGTTFYGGVNNDGTVFKITPGGVLTTLFSFNGANGQYPYSSLVQGSDGNFYGTTAYGGSNGLGTVFKITPAGILTSLVSFNNTNGNFPDAAMMQGSDGNFYGTTYNGGDSGIGTIFRMTPAGVLTTLVSFNIDNGASPNAALVQGSDGNFYGTTQTGGSSSGGGWGTVFKMTPAGVLTTLASFNFANGGFPFSNLVEGSDGNYYGTTAIGGSGNYGTVFRITPAGTLTTLVSFNGSNGYAPTAGLVAGSDGNFYGTVQSGSVSGDGAIFKMTLAGDFNTVVSFTGPDGRYPYNGVVQGSDGNLYGTTTFGGSFADGEIFQLTFPQTVAPVFSPTAGAYASVQTVTITSTTAGASIRYTTDSSTPTETNGTLYSGPINIGGTTTLKAIAYANGLVDSTVATAVYILDIPGVVQAPTFSPVGGTYSSAQSVSLNSATTGAIIRYTTDGSTPSQTNGLVYSSAVSVSANTTINAIAYKSGMTDSTVSSSNYVLQVAAPTFGLAGGTYASVQSATINCPTSGATIRYTTDGSTPTETNGTLYSGPVNINITTTLKAIAFETGFSDSTVVTAVYTLQAAAPAFSPAGGTYTSAQSVTLTSATSGASINYTTDGSTPTETHGTLYTGPVSIGTTTILSAIAFKNGYIDSGVAIAGYTINLPPITPTFSPAAGTYGSAQSVTITSVSDATIRYTTDGSTPTETNGTIYSSPVSITKTTILKAIAYKSGYPDTSVASGIYTITSSPAAILNVIYNFISSGNGGFYPYAGLVQGTDGNLYGTANEGGSSNAGTVFKITPTGSLTALTSFTGSNGGYPFAGLVQSTDGNFYGTTNTPLSNPSLTYPGTAFKITPTGTLTTLVTFSSANGIFPFAGLIQGTDGNFYGATFEAGSGSYGTVFKMTPAGGLTTLVSFAGANGGLPNENLIQGSDGNFYGMTYEGGSTYVSINNLGEGTIFRMTPAGALTTLVSFTGANGSYPVANLVQGIDGNFYGTTTEDNVNDDGTVFKMTPAGVLTTLAYFSSTSGQYPNALVQGSDGNFYGTTEGTGSGGKDGTVFKITPAGVLTTLASFDSANGNEPLSGLVQGNDGNFYGTTVLGGSSNVGVVFQLIVPACTAAPVFSPAPGTYTGAQTVTITSATSGASIRYTTNGSTPTETTGTLYSSPVSISSTTTLNAIAFKSGMADSAVVTPAYTIQAATSSSGGSSSSSPASSDAGGGGGGGAFDDWFLGFLAVVGIWQWKRHKD
jgi:uncharacterized repeat protein (TIGR03803 family)